jgi:hypothetical protein
LAWLLLSQVTQANSESHPFQLGAWLVGKADSQLGQKASAVQLRQCIQRTMITASDLLLVQRRHHV